MRFCGTLLVVKDCRSSYRYYHEMFGLELIADHDGNLELSDHIFLQEKGFWENFIGKPALPRSNHTELYFEDPDPAAFVRKLVRYYPETEFVNRLMTHSWGQQVVRFYDPDGNLIEVGTPI